MIYPRLDRKLMESLVSRFSVVECGESCVGVKIVRWGIRKKCVAAYTVNQLLMRQ